MSTARDKARSWVATYYGSVDTTALMLAHEAGQRSERDERDAAVSVEQIQDAVARVEEIVFKATGEHVFRDGWSGAFTECAAELAEMFQAAAEGKSPVKPKDESHG